jgi:hypothetical protein
MPRITLLMLSLLVATASAGSSSMSSVCDGVPLTVGQWARFEFDGFGSVTMTARYAIVGTEPVDGVEHYWLEFEVPMPTGNTSMIFKLLIPGWPYESESVRGAVMKMSTDLPAMEAPPEMAMNMGKDNLSDPLVLACAEDEATPDSVTVPAGTFTATRNSPRSYGRDVWLSSEVPFGLVKTAEPDGKGLRLLEFGTGAESAITETPQRMPGGP